MSDIDIRKAGRAGRITLNRPKALNALTYEMCLAIEDALDNWAADPEVACVVIDAAGDRAFCAGGDIVEMYETGRDGNYEYGRQFWRDEYRLNAKIHTYPKPYVAFMQGFTMGGGVGVSCHGSHRVVGESSKIAMPEVGIGLIPDVGGSLILARAPGRLGEYLGTTGARMGPGDAIHAGFADHYLPEESWAAAIADLEETGAAETLAARAVPPPDSRLAAQAAEIDRHFGRMTLADIVRSLEADEGDFARETLAALGRVSPLSAAATIEIVRRVRELDTIEDALATEFLFTYRGAEMGDFVEGIRAAVIDKDRSPRWRHPSLTEVPEGDVAAMLAPLGDEALSLEPN